MAVKYILLELHFFCARCFVPLNADNATLCISAFLVLPGLPLHRDLQKRLVLKPWVDRA
jgi:hypothetical protein